MKKTLLAAILFLFSYIGLGAQSLGYVNTTKILEKIPEYKGIQSQLDALKKQYDLKIEQEYSKIETLFNNYQSQKSMLTENQRKIREDEIIKKERTVKDLQKLYLGQEGELSKKTAELLNPLKTKVQDAVNAVAEESKVILVFDVATTQGIIYNNPNYDLTIKVLKKLKLN